MQDWLAHRARATPGRQALVNAGSGNAWSYATLDETVEEMAGRLHALGVEEDDHLGAVLGTGVEGVCLVHAAMRLGTTLVPLSPDFTPPELSERFERADVDAVVCDASTEDTVRQAAVSIDPWLSVLTIDDANWSEATPLADAKPTKFTPRDWSRDGVQLLLFTSGTTGRAKAVQLTMGNLLASATASAFRLGIDPEDRWFVPLSLHHMGGIAPVLRSALYGTTAIIRESFDPGGTVDDIHAYDATCVSLVPTMLRQMLSARGTLPDCLRFLLVGGAPCPEELIHRCRDYSVPVCPTYGMTETASQIATARHREAYENPDSVGQPLLWTDVTVIDEAGDPIEPGETGELVVDGPTVTPGYYDDPAATAEAMGPHGLHTGDVGYQNEEGRLYVLNRLDDRILTGGENVDPGEVVDAIREHPEVAEAAVVGLPDKKWGEQVTALLVPENEPVSTDKLESFLRDRLAGFKLPRTLGFAEELPRTVSGTVERETVRERLTEGETVQIERSEPNEGAATETENERSAISGDTEPETQEPADGLWESEVPTDESVELTAGDSTETKDSSTAAANSETSPPSIFDAESEAEPERGPPESNDELTEAEVDIENTESESSGYAGQTEDITNADEGTEGRQIDEVPDDEKPTVEGKWEKDTLESQDESTSSESKRKGSAALSADLFDETGESGRDEGQTDIGAALGTGQNANEPEETDVDEDTVDNADEAADNTDDTADDADNTVVDTNDGDREADGVGDEAADLSTRTTDETDEDVGEPADDAA